MSDVSKGNWVVWIIASLSGVFVVAGIGFAFVELETSPPDNFAFRGFDAVAGAAYVTVALLILQRQPSHGVGVTFLAVGSVSTAYWAVSQYGYAAELGGTGWPGGAYAAWVISWGWMFLTIPVLGLIPALFPHGRLETRLDRGLALLSVLAVVFGYLGYGTRPGLLPDQAAYAVNPLPIGFLPHGFLEAVSNLFVVAVAIGGAGALIQAYRGGGETERLQVKWLMAAITFLGLAIATAASLFLIAPDWTDERLLFFETLVFVGILTIPASIGFAITRYRLYDIEVVINRAIVYGPLTALVAASYVVAVQLARLAFIASTGERSESELLVATLIAAAVFWIIRARMVRMVDQHFKDPREPAKDLRALQDNLRQMTRIIDPAAISRERLADYVLTSCVAAFDAEGGRIDLYSTPGTPIVAGAIVDAPLVSMDITHDGKVFGNLQLGARTTSRAYSRRDTGPLLETVEVLGEILARDSNAPPNRRRTPAKRSEPQSAS